ncbi:radical SAM protein [bacterium]|nr:radical SAM protein [bacterium]MBU1984484.1 radical SAM protein [bacterium]
MRERLPKLYGLLDPCRLCPRRCGVHRTSGELGECGMGGELMVSSVGLHFGEESPISGHRGSGTIFLSGCNLHCVFCQNWTISQLAEGERVTVAELAEAMLGLERSGAHNINWVSPTHMVPMLMEAFCLAGEHGLSIPLVYNSGGYDSLEVLKLLDGMVDVYMPDMKYGDAAVARRLSGVEDYPAHNQAAIREMYRQVEPLQLDASGVAVCGLLIRHLVLPENQAGSEAVFTFLDEELPGPVDVNVMAQYHPCHLAWEHPELERCPSRDEFQAALRLARSKSSIRIVD